MGCGLWAFCGPPGLPGLHHHRGHIRGHRVGPGEELWRRQRETSGTVVPLRVTSAVRVVRVVPRKGADDAPWSWPRPPLFRGQCVRAKASSRGRGGDTGGAVAKDTALDETEMWGLPSQTVGAAQPMPHCPFWSPFPGLSALRSGAAWAAGKEVMLGPWPQQQHNWTTKWVRAESLPH